jgi:hypothetical protein
MSDLIGRAKGLLARADVAIAAAPKTKISIAAAPPRQPALTGSNLVAAIDATSSRSKGWAAKKRLQDQVIKLIPEHYNVALAVYHNDLDTFVFGNRRKLRALAADIYCTGVMECLPAVLARAVNIRNMAAVINITDESSACDEEVCQYVETLRERGTRVFILLDFSDGGPPVYIPGIFAWVAARTNGAVLPFHPAALPKLFRYLNGSTASVSQWFTRGSLSL